MTRNDAFKRLFIYECEEESVERSKGGDKVSGELRSGIEAAGQTRGHGRGQCREWHCMDGCFQNLP